MDGSSLMAVIGGVSTVLGAFTGGYYFSKSRNGYVKSSTCERIHNEENVRRDTWRTEIRSDLKEIHNRITEVAQDTAELRGRIKGDPFA